MQMFEYNSRYFEEKDEIHVFTGPGSAFDDVKQGRNAAHMLADYTIT